MGKRSMSTLGGRRGGWLAALAVLGAVASDARAQRLNFGTPPAPPPGESPGSVALKESMTGPAPNPIGRVWIPDHRLAELTRSRTHALAAALVARAEELGEPGSIHHANAALLLQGSDWIDDLVQASRDAGPEAQVLGAALRAYVHAVDEALRSSAGVLPPTADELDRFMQSLFAPLAQAAADRLPERGGGWRLARTPAPANSIGTHTAPTHAELRAMLDDSAFAMPDAAAAAELRSMLAAMEEASALWAFSGAVEEARALIGGALPLALEREGALPDWFAAAPRATIAGRTSVALGAFAASSRNHDAAETLAAAAGIARLAHRADALAPAGARDSLTFRLALCDAAAEAMGEPDPSRERGRKALRALDRTFDLLEDRADIGVDADVARELRVSFRALDAAATKTESQLVAQLPQIAMAESATSEPAIIAAIAAHRRALDDLRMLRTVDALLSRHKDDRSPTWRLASARLLRLGQEIGRADAADSSLVALRAFAGAVELLDAMPAEAAVRAGGDESVALIGEHAGVLVNRLDEWRAAYLEAWAREGDGAPGTTTPAAPDRGPRAGPGSDELAARLRVLRSLFILIDDTLVVRSLAAPGAARLGLRAWPGLPVSARGLAFAAGGDELSQQIRRAAAMAVDPAQTAAARQAVRQIETTRPTLRLLAELDRAARARGAAWIWPIAVCAAPPTRSAWLVGERGRLASIGRYLDDAANTPAREEREMAVTMAYVDYLSRQLLEAGLER